MNFCVWSEAGDTIGNIEVIYIVLYFDVLWFTIHKPNTEIKKKQNQTTTTTSVELVVYLKIKKSFLKFIVMVIIFKHGNLIFNFKAVPYGFWYTKHKKSSRCHRKY